MTPIRIHNVTKKYGAALAVDQVSLVIDAGELFFLLGPSGCGKTTLLRMLAGFVQPDGGEIFFGDRNITHLPPRLRGAALVFQTYALWPHMTVAKNVAYGLNVRGLPKQEVAHKVERALKLVRMEGFGERKPAQLSGGQQQRIALARALVIEPQVLLLDEPLSNLDARLRDEMREEIRRLHQETRLTMIYVTHDQKEALTLADRLAVMKSGMLIQVGAPRDVYHRPNSRFVAGFLGDANFIPGTVKKQSSEEVSVETALGILQGCPPAVVPKPGAKVLCSFRPQSLTVGAGKGNNFQAQVEQSTFLGELVEIDLRAGANTPLKMLSLPQHAWHLKRGEKVELSVPPDQVVILEDA